MIIGNANAFLTKPPPPHHPPSQRTLVVHWATWGVLQQAHFSYTEDARRSQMFHQAPGVIPVGGMHADCSQFVASVLHWVGIEGLNDTDFTGTLLKKGKLISVPAIGDVVIWGPGDGTHTAFYVGNGFTIGFGHSPGAPNRVKISDMNAYFRSVGKPGVRYLSFCP